MATYNGFFMRDSLSDTGEIPSPGYPYYSPDVICHEQVANPQTYFVQNYNTNPNQPAELGSQTNYIYTRARNLATTSLSGWSISVYRSSSSLFLNTNLWSQNPLLTASGKSFVTLNTTPTQGIAVGNDVLFLDAVTSNLFCLIGMATPQQPPVIPPPFTSYSDYILWVRMNQNVCGNNLTIARNFATQQYSRIDSLSNPENDYVPVLFVISVVGTLPAGSTFGVTCAPINVNSSWNISQGPVQTASGMMPPHFDGYVTTWGSLPSGQIQWPNGVRINNETYIGRDVGDPAAAYAAPWEHVRMQPGEMPGMPRTGVLVLLGSTGTYFSTGV